MNNAKKTSRKGSIFSLTPDRLLSFWQRISAYPGGKALFNTLIGLFVPYTGTIGCRVQELGPGNSRVELSDHRKVRNHLKSIHAIALANLGEVTSGLPLLCALGKDMRAIIVNLHIEYVKKARGCLTATADFDPDRVRTPGRHEVKTIIYGEPGVEVANVTTTWLVSPVLK